MNRSLFSRLLISNWLLLISLIALAILMYFAQSYIGQEYWYAMISFYTIVAMFSALFLSQQIAYNVSETLKMIERKAREINAGDFGAELPAPDIKELADLTQAINSMSNRLQSQFNDLSIEKEKFNSLLQNLREGVFAIDPENKILFQNKNTPVDLIKPNSIGLDISDVGSEKFLQFLQRPILEKVDEKSDIQMGEKFYRVGIYPLKTEEQKYMFIGVIRDKTQEIQTQRIREEFVQNASHELKTPITSIKGYAQTLEIKLKMDPDSVEKRFLDAILRNTERMVRIIEDMLTISRLEDYSAVCHYESFPLKSLVKNLKYTVEGFAGLKNQNLKIEIPDDLKMRADIVLMEHLLINLLSNAFHYSPEGSDVIIRAEKVNEEIVLRVADQGIGILPEDQTRIFERFYRVDKNRSRKEGGTGLGLSIVKHIVRLHKGSISVEPNVLCGSIFIVKIPIREMASVI